MSCQTTTGVPMLGCCAATPTRPVIRAVYASVIPYFPATMSQVRAKMEEIVAKVNDEPFIEDPNNFDVSASVVLTGIIDHNNDTIAWERREFFNVTCATFVATGGTFTQARGYNMGAKKTKVIFGSTVGTCVEQKTAFPSIRVFSPCTEITSSGNKTGVESLTGTTASELVIETVPVSQFSDAELTNGQLRERILTYSNDQTIPLPCYGAP